MYKDLTLLFSTADVFSARDSQITKEKKMESIFKFKDSIQRGG